MITLEKITKVTLISLLFLQLFTYEAFAVTCSCGFDTSEYSAVAEGEGYCSSVTENGKHCSISFNGKVEEAATIIEPSSIYGSLNQYMANMRTTNRKLYESGYLAALRNPDWLIKNLPLMMRSSYATAVFLSHQEKERLDSIVYNFFKSYGKKTYNAVIGKEKAFSEENFEVTKGRIQLNVEDILVVFAIFIPKEF